MRFNPFNNLTLKIGAVLLALLLWVHVATNKTYEYQIDCDFRPKQRSRRTCTGQRLSPTVTLRVKTTGKQLIALATRSISLCSRCFGISGRFD